MLENKFKWEVENWLDFAKGMAVALVIVIALGFMEASLFYDRIYQHRHELDGFVADTCTKLSPDPRGCYNILCKQKEATPQ